MFVWNLWAVHFKSLVVATVQFDRKFEDDEELTSGKTWWKGQTRFLNQLSDFKNVSWSLINQSLVTFRPLKEA